MAAGAAEKEDKMRFEEELLKQYKENIREDCDNDPDSMFIAGCGWKEASIVTALTKYVKETSGDYRIFQEILYSLVEHGAMEEADCKGYIIMAGVMRVFDTRLTPEEKAELKKYLKDEPNGQLTIGSIIFLEDENENE